MALLCRAAGHNPCALLGRVSGLGPFSSLFMLVCKLRPPLSDMINWQACKLGSVDVPS